MTVANRHMAPIEVAEQPGGLLQTARPLPSEDWRGGVTFTSVCTTLGRWGCVTDGETEKEIGARSEPVRFDPFMLYSGTACSGAPDEQELRGIARAGLTRGKSGEIAHELVTSLFGNPDLSTTATNITPTAGPSFDPQPLKNSIAGLLSAISECGGGEVYLHAHISTLPYLMDMGVVWTGTEYKLGAISISLDDYPFLDDDEAAGAANPSWTPLYMTRPVELMVATASDDYDLTTRINEGQAVSEDFAVLRFDTCCAFAIYADLGKSN